MTLTRSQLEGFDAQPLLDIADGLKRTSMQLENLFERYAGAVAAPGWQGLAAEAAQDRARKDRKTAYSMADTLTASARLLEQGYWDIGTALRTALQSIASAEAAGFLVGPQLGVLHPPDPELTSAKEVARAEWESGIRAAADAVAAEDERLQQDLARLGAAMRAEFDAIGGSQTTLDEKRFVEAGRFIFDEMKRNINSGVVEKIRGLLGDSKGIDQLYGLRPSAALALWFAKVAPGREWDHKPQLKQLLGLKKSNDFYFKQPGTDRKVYYDIYSNMHYGYVGRAAGFDAVNLIKGASEPSWLVGEHDEADEITMRAGIALYDKYGPNMTPEQFNQGVVVAVNQMEAAENEGRDLTQLRHEN
ncbi:polymorphic toxin type 44 domain-containing protein [Nocardia brasiliensis]